MNAPFIIVSGGNVHPARTPFNEAVEMKAVLIREFGLSEAEVLIDPHARHTTTNVRNAVRILFRSGAPMDRPFLVVSDERQIAGIAADAFDTRNRTETGIIPYDLKRLVSRFEVEIQPSLDALQINPTDPLDP